MINENEARSKHEAIPVAFREDVDYGLYGGMCQYFIKGVDGTLAQLGRTLPSSPERLRSRIDGAKKAQAEMEAHRG